MNKDLIVGLFVSILVHGGFLFGGDIFKRSAPPKEKPPEEKLIQMQLPPEEPDKEDEVKEIAEEQVQNQMAPPSLVDLPSVVQVTSFVQQVQPPPPPGLTTDKAALSIPVVKPGTNFGAGMKDLFNAADLDQPLEPRARPQFNYPFEMKRAGITGEVTAEYIVDTNGNVSQVQIIKSTNREFEEPVKLGLLKWRYKPGKKGGRAVNTHVVQTFPFVLSQD